ncbi:MAG: hypothetical protein HOQ45_19825 [Nocardioidaceae bacterium]|nr:hypothetical protein [Nocardioidaceae bacterium]
MSPFSTPVLLGATVVSGPALYGAFVSGTTSTQTALLRFLVCAGLAWLGLAVVSMLVGPPPRAEAVAVEDETAEEPAAHEEQETPAL